MLQFLILSYKLNIEFMNSMPIGLSKFSKFILIVGVVLFGPPCTCVAAKTANQNLFLCIADKAALLTVSGCECNDRTTCTVGVVERKIARRAGEAAVSVCTAVLAGHSQALINICTNTYTVYTVTHSQCSLQRHLQAWKVGYIQCWENIKRVSGEDVA